MYSILPRVGIVLLIVALASACGLKDDLYLPDPDASAASSDATDPDNTRRDDDAADS